MSIRLSPGTRDLLLLAGLMNTIVIGLAIWELIPIYDGLPYDSVTYADIVHKFAACGFRIRLDSYYMQRLFPSAVVSGIAWLLHMDITRPYLVNAFRLLDLAAIDLAFFLTANLLRLHGIRGRARMLALILCFGNFCILKFALYLPAATDCCTIAIGAALLYAYCRGWPRLLLVLGSIGAFTHPLLIFVSAVLYLYPSSGGQPRELIPGRPAFRWLPYFAAAAYLLLCSLFYVFAYEDMVERTMRNLAPVNMQLFFVSAAVGGAYLFILARLAVMVDLPARLFRDLRRDRLLPVILLAASIRLFQLWRATGPGPLNARSYGINVLMGSLTQPGQFLVAHTSFLGPVVPLVAILFPAFRQQLARQGTGFIAVLLGLLLLMLNSESRQCSFCLPFLVLPLALAFKDREISRNQMIVLGSAAILISKVWLPINYGPPSLLRDPGRLNQRLFLNIGPWMLWQTYLAQALAYAGIGLLLCICFRNRPPALPGIVLPGFREKRKSHGNE